MYNLLIESQGNMDIHFSLFQKFPQGPKLLYGVCECLEKNRVCFIFGNAVWHPLDTLNTTLVTGDYPCNW